MKLVNKGPKARLKKEEIFENMVYVSDTSWVFGLDDKEHRFGVLFEITDMMEATGEKEFEEYPIVVSASIVAHNCHKSFNEMDSDHKPTRLSLLYDAHQYMGGVPVDHVLTREVRAGNETDKDALLSLLEGFTPGTYMIKTERPRFGTVAAQYGQDTPFKYVRFADQETAEKYIDMILERRVQALGMMIGFILDRPINLMGDTGWSVVEKMVNGK